MEASVKYHDKQLNAEVEERLQTFSVADQEEQQINASNNILLFRPKFIPIYTWVTDLGFTDSEAKIFGYIDFFFSSNTHGRFYFTNKQIAYACSLFEGTVSRGLSKLEKAKLVMIHRKITSRGQQRFIDLAEQSSVPLVKKASPLVNLPTPLAQNSKQITITNNNINNMNINLKGKLQSNYAIFIQYFNELTNRKFGISDKKAKRQFEYLTNQGYTSEQFKIVIKNAYDDDFHTKSSFKYLTPEFLTRPDKFERYLSLNEGVKKIETQEDRIRKFNEFEDKLINS